jgi:predicted aspartyl protease
MRVVWSFLFALGVLCAAAAASADPLPTAAEIVAKADAFYGPAPKNYRETIVGTGTLGDTRETTYRSGDDVRNTFDRGPLHGESGTYHGENWILDENGLVVVNTKDPGKAAHDKLTTTVSRVRNPVDAYVVSKLNVRAAGTRRYYDPMTFRLLRVEDVGPTGTVTTVFGDADRYGDRTLARHWETDSPAAKTVMKYERTEYVANQVTDADVEEPTTRRLLVEFPPGITRASLPVRIYENNVIVRVNIGSQAADFVLDTGASSIFIDSDFARRIGLSLTNASSEVEAQRFTGYETVVPEMRIGPVAMHDIVADVGPMLGNYGPEIKPVGLLGFDFLAQLGVTIDYEKGTLTVVPAASFQPPADPSMYVFQVRLGEFVPMVTAKIGDAVAERVILDTGGSLPLWFFDYFTRRYPQAFPATAYLGQISSRGVGGDFSADVYVLPDVQLGPVHFRDFQALRVPISGSYAADDDGVIGNVLLSKFIVTLDYTDALVFLVPTSDTKRKLMPIRH